MFEKFFLLGSKKKVAIGIATLIGIVGIASALNASRDPHVCSRGETNKVTKKFDRFIDEWDNANAIASSSPRIALGNPVARLQEIQQQIKGSDFPKCAKNVIKEFDRMADETIKGYLMFMQRDYDTREQIDKASGATSTFARYYRRLKDGKSTDDLEIIKETASEAEEFLKQFEGK